MPWSVVSTGLGSRWRKGSRSSCLSLRWARGDAGRSAAGCARDPAAGGGACFRAWTSWSGSDSNDGNRDGKASGGPSGCTLMARARARGRTSMLGDSAGRRSPPAPAGTRAPGASAARPRQPGARRPVRIQARAGAGDIRTCDHAPRPALPPAPTSPSHRAEHRRVRDELIKTYGGLTAYARAPATGYWNKEASPSAPVVRDDIVVYEVLCHTSMAIGGRPTARRSSSGFSRTAC